MCGGAGPRSPAEFDHWVQRRLLNPASAMFREGGLLLREEPSITDPTSYAAVLSAISAGATRQSEIAAALGRPASAIAHLLTGLADIGLIEQTEDALRGKRTTFSIADMRQLRRLEHLRGLLPSGRIDRQPRLLLFSRSGFTPDLTDEAAIRPDVDLIGLDRIYRGT